MAAVAELVAGVGHQVETRKPVLLALMLICRLRVKRELRRFRAVPPETIPPERRVELQVLRAVTTGLAAQEAMQTNYWHMRWREAAARSGDAHEFARALGVEAGISASFRDGAALASAASRRLRARQRRRRQPRRLAQGPGSVHGRASPGPRRGQPGPRRADADARHRDRARLGATPGQRAPGLGGRLLRAPARGHRALRTDLSPRPRGQRSQAAARRRLHARRRSRPRR